MTEDRRLELMEEVVRMLRTVFDPEMPVDVYSLGLVYNIEIDDDANVHIDMTLTAPNCPAADFIFEDIRQKVESIDDIKSCNVQLVFEPEWDIRMMSDEAKLELGMM
ncbi:MAG: DUF59 domain-containing protein [Muribaculaceae bacterium]|nr:DUF59 domain-containing protein [Muribaculaceae bacterium]